MADATDSYSRWLGIPAEEQPPNHYRLLGVGLFEPDRTAIDAAAKRLMAHLQRSASGDDAPSIRGLLTEIANARICLLTPQKRNDYDARLRSTLNSSRSAAAPIPKASPPAKAVANGPSDEAIASDNTAWADDGGSVVAAIPVDEDLAEPVPPPTSRPQQIAAAKPAAAPKPSGAAPARKAPDGAKPKTAAMPAAAESEFNPGPAQGSFFADLGLGSGIGGRSGEPSPAASWASESADEEAGPTGAAKATSAGKAKASLKAFSKSTANTNVKSKGAGAGGGSSQKKNPFKLQSWHIPAMVGGGVLVLVVVVIIVMSLGGGSSTSRSTAQTAPVDTGPPRFGPGSFSGTIDDITTHSPLGARTTAVVPLDRQGDLLLVNVKINGQDAGKFLLDTGAFDVIVSTKVADRLKLPELGRSTFQGPHGKQSASTRKLKSVGLGTVEFEDKMILPPRPKGDWTAIAVDMKPWEDSLKVQISGVIGCDILYQMPVSINPLKKSLTFFNRHKFQLSNNQHPEFMSLVDSKPFMSASLDHAPADEKRMFLLATGAPTGIMVPASDSKIASLNLFGEEFSDPVAETLAADTVYSTGDAREIGVIGSSVLANFEILLDFQNSKIIATRLAPK
jgi:hypothetical protein